MWAMTTPPGLGYVAQVSTRTWMWRTTEPARRSTRDAYPAAFRMTQADIDHAIEVPAVPPLLPR
ncbi:non-oxidative hydroxyarylic acid decarboxylases subunit D [Streptomyces sp. NPDC048275]|uniref:non-oxidative hydroxyarylic acid decarboxylases subunit D n=1 Tax=Streptomyces sp. NPDC048275 TaxID=3155629 RepID=UPI003401199B